MSSPRHAAPSRHPSYAGRYLPLRTAPSTEITGPPAGRATEADRSGGPPPTLHHPKGATACPSPARTATSRRTTAASASPPRSATTARPAAICCRHAAAGRGGARAEVAARDRRLATARPSGAAVDDRMMSTCPDPGPRPAGRPPRRARAAGRPGRPDRRRAAARERRPALRRRRCRQDPAARRAAHPRRGRRLPGPRRALPRLRRQRAALPAVQRGLRPAGRRLPDRWPGRWSRPARPSPG